METRYLLNEIKNPIESIKRLSRIPLLVNIEMYKGDIVRTKHWKRKVLIDGKVIIALIHNKRDCNTKIKMMIQGGCSFGYEQSHVYTKKNFRLILDFQSLFIRPWGRLLIKLF